jgi:hypothetical protein
MKKNELIFMVNPSETYRPIGLDKLYTTCTIADDKSEYYMTCQIRHYLKSTTLPLGSGKPTPLCVQLLCCTQIQYQW